MDYIESGEIYKPAENPKKAKDGKKYCGASIHLAFYPGDDLSISNSVIYIETDFAFLYGLSWLGLIGSVYFLI